MSELEAVAANDKPPAQQVLWLLNKGRAALGLRSLPELPKGVAPWLHHYLRHWVETPEVADNFYSEEREEELARFPAGAVRPLEADIATRIGWLDAWPERIWSPVGIALHCEAVGEPWSLRVRSAAAARALSKAFGTARFSDANGGFTRVKLPETLDRFMDYYRKGFYSELSDPSVADLRLYDLQSELDARDFAERFRVSGFWRIAVLVVLIVLGLEFVRLLL